MTNGKNSNTTRKRKFISKGWLRGLPKESLLQIANRSKIVVKPNNKEKIIKHLAGVISFEALSSAELRTIFKTYSMSTQKQTTKKGLIEIISRTRTPTTKPPKKNTKIEEKSVMKPGNLYSFDQLLKRLEGTNW